VLGVYYGLNSLIKDTLLPLLLSIVVGMLLYFILLLVFRCLKEEDFRSIPMGGTLLRILKILHLM